MLRIGLCDDIADARLLLEDALERALDICMFTEKKYKITGRADGATCEQFGDYVMETLSNL